MINSPRKIEAELISEKDFERVAILVNKMTGISLQSNKRTMVSGRLLKQIRKSGYASLEDYLVEVGDQNNKDVRETFISSLTTNMTRFQREAHHFKHLATKVLPNLHENAKRGEKIRIWSAACSSGEEIYDISFQLWEVISHPPSYDIKLLATDIDTDILNFARRGEYHNSKTQQIPEPLLRKYLQTCEKGTDHKKIRTDLQDLIDFSRINLNSNWKMPIDFDVIFCRNAAIYFDEETQNKLWRRLVSKLKHGGVIYIGHSEALPDDLMKFVKTEDIGTFRRNQTPMSSDGEQTIWERKKGSNI